MKITDLKSYLIQMDWDDRTGGSEPKNTVKREFVFVQIDTDEGITGWGEITNYPGNIGNRAIQKYTSEIKDFLVGKDPTRIEEIWARTFRLFTYTGTRGATTAAMSGIDIALWDIFGKSLNLPIYKLLGGAVRESIPLYTHPPEPGLDIELAVRDAKEIVASGHMAFKMDPMMHSLDGGNVGFLDGEISAEGAERAEQITAEVRDAVGPNIEILIDAHGRFNVPTAIDLANRLEPYGIHWFEEPVPPDNVDAMAQVASKTSIPIATGERLSTKYEFAKVIEKKAASVIQFNLGRVGGILEAKKIAAIAEAHGVQIAPHLYCGPIVGAANIQIATCIPNFLILESIKKMDGFYAEILTKPIQWDQGYVIPSKEPGLGVEINEDVARKYPYKGEKLHLQVSNEIVD